MAIGSGSGMNAILFAMAVAGASPFGIWMTDDRSALVRISQCGQSLCGDVVKVLAAGPGVPRTDVHNPNSALRNRALQGLTILGGFRGSGTSWTDGHIYDPNTGRTYRSKLTINRDGTLGVSGCILFVCQTRRWARAQ
jgi:uncharacterized protein (DUF2147 family)